MIDEHTSNPTPGVGRKRGGRAKPDWSRNSKAKTQTPASYDSYDPKNMENRPVPPEAFVRSLSAFLGSEMVPVTPTSAVFPGSPSPHPGDDVLVLPWPRLWIFKRKGVRAGGSGFTGHAVVGSWQIAHEPLSCWLYAAELTALSGFRRECELRRLQGKDFSQVPQGLTFAILPPEWNWLEPRGENVHLLLAVAPDDFPDMVDNEDD
jgi:hypothetical protein